MTQHSSVYQGQWVGTTRIEYSRHFLFKVLPAGELATVMGVPLQRPTFDVVHKRDDTLHFVHVCSVNLKPREPVFESHIIWLSREFGIFVRRWMLKRGHVGHCKLCVRHLWHWQLLWAHVVRGGCRSWCFGCGAGGV